MKLLEVHRFDATGYDVHIFTDLCDGPERLISLHPALTADDVRDIVDDVLPISVDTTEVRECYIFTPEELNALRGAKPHPAWSAAKREALQSAQDKL
jgi:hypothetical protein